MTLLGCVNPYDDDYSETLSTLKFVKEAKELKMTPAMNKCIEEYKVVIIVHFGFIAFID